jgi:SWI/SNF-related matrix-associated actin-dependent regulator of chromatin subfamily A member 5
MVKVPTLLATWSRLHFQYIVLDEGHKIKNHLTQISQAVRRLHCENRLLLTGTPLQNNLVELWSLLNFLYPEVFTTSEPFEAAFNITENIINKEKLEQAHQLLELFMLRRLKTQVEKLMPLKLETKVRVWLAEE